MKIYVNPVSTYDVLVKKPLGLYSFMRDLVRIIRLTGLTKVIMDYSGV